MYKKVIKKLEAGVKRAANWFIFIGVAIIVIIAIAYYVSIVDGFSETYDAITKDALYESISSKQRWGKLSDWEQGYIDGYNNGRPTGVHDKIKGNPSNWRCRYIEYLFKRNESSDAQYINGYADGFKAGYQSGY